MTGSIAVVAGALANKVGNGGESWVRPTWTIGLGRLGFDAWLVEEIAPGPDGAADPAAVDWFVAVTSRFGLADRAALLCGGTSVAGPPAEVVADVLTDAGLLVNVSGHLPRPERRAPAAVRLYLDLDPGFTQCWAADGLLDLGGHTHFATVGTAVGTAETSVPDAGRRWVRLLPPVLLDHWAPTAPPGPPARFTTVGSWRPPHGTLVHDGRAFGIKAHEFRRFLDLPADTDAELDLALSIHPADGADRERLLAAGFTLSDPSVVAATPDAFADWVRRSTGEWSVAQGVYVGLRSGWVSDRSAHYLAAGRAVVVQDTGAALPSGDGYFTFEEPADAAKALARVLDDPAGSAGAARAVAEEHFDAGRVLGDLCERIGVSP